MAVVEISRIQVRRGQENQTGVPTLAGGEFGWAADTEHLYIGLRRDDGGARDANVRILTENDLFNVVTTADLGYTYRGDTSPAITAPSFGGVPFERPINKKNDDIVSITDFGVSGVGGDEVVSALMQVAIDNLFLDPLKTTSDYGKNSAKVLHLPAGVYNIDTTIFIPKHTTIVGEGPDKTIINLISNVSHVFQTIDADPDNVNEPGRTTFDNLAFGGINSGGSQPTDIYIEGLTIRYDSSLTNTSTSLSLMSLDCADNSVIRNVKFLGNRAQGGQTTSTYVGIDIRCYGGDTVSASNILIDECEFTGLRNSIQSNYDVYYTTIQNSRFYNSLYGIIFNNPKNSQADTGPKYATIDNNLFKNIELEAIYAGDGTSDTNHVSSNNKFYNVGNLGQSELVATAPVINYKTTGNRTVNDYFDRFYKRNNGIAEDFYYQPLVQGPTILELPVLRASLNDNALNRILRLPTSFDAQQIIIKYNIFAASYDPVTKIPTASVDRMGTLRITLQTGNIVDDYSFNVDPGLVIWSMYVDYGKGRFDIQCTYTPPAGYTNGASMNIHPIIML